METPIAWRGVDDGRLNPARPEREQGPVAVLWDREKKSQVTSATKLAIGTKGTTVYQDKNGRTKILEHRRRARGRLRVGSRQVNPDAGGVRSRGYKNKR